MKVESEIERKKRIEKVYIKLLQMIESVPYKEKIDNIDKDTNRLRKDTVSSSAEPYHEYDLFKVDGYNDKQIFKDKRFRLIMALRNAGLQNNDYARNMVINLQSDHIRKLHE